jgi:hypothetical protein
VCVCECMHTRSKTSAEYIWPVNFTYSLLINDFPFLPTSHFLTTLLFPTLSHTLNLLMNCMYIMCFLIMQESMMWGEMENH